MKQTIETKDMIAYVQNLYNLSYKSKTSAGAEAWADEALACVQMIRRLTGAETVEMTEDGTLVIK